MCWGFGTVSCYGLELDGHMWVLRLVSFIIICNLGCNKKLV